MIGSKGRADADDASHEEEEDVDLSDLPTVQLKVLDRMRRGKTIKAIALELHLPQRTIKLYVRQGLRHLRARNRETLLSLIRRPH
jgi:DNA-binding NarL/FixJ family response regulator